MSRSITKALLSTVLTLALFAGWAQAQGEETTLRNQPDAEMSLYTPEQHDLYDGHFILSASRIYQVGRLDDSAGWDHMGNDAGDFPFVRVLRVIDGREMRNRVHGTSDMPVWGDVFKAESSGSEPIAAGRVLLLTEYLQSIQEQ